MRLVVAESTVPNRLPILHCGFAGKLEPLIVTVDATLPIVGLMVVMDMEAADETRTVSKGNIAHTPSFAE